MERSPVMVAGTWRAALAAIARLRRLRLISRQERTQSMRWKAYIEGDAIDLNILRRTFPSGESEADPQVGEDSAGFYFESDRLDPFEGIGNDAHRVAEEIVRGLNGVARMLDSGFRP